MPAKIGDHMFVDNNIIIKIIKVVIWPWVVVIEERTIVLVGSIVTDDD